MARLAEGEVARRAGARAMIDVSDGLALDLHRLADASGVGFELDAVPVAEGATLDEALGGGEDYELVVVIEPDASTATRAVRRRPGCGRRGGSARWSPTGTTGDARRRGARAPGMAAPLG